MTAGWLLITKRVAQQLSWERLELKWVANLQKMLLIFGGRSELVQNILESLKYLQINKKNNLLYQADPSTSNRLNPGLSSLMISLKRNIYLRCWLCHYFRSEHDDDVHSWPKRLKVEPQRSALTSDDQPRGTIARFPHITTCIWREHPEHCVLGGSKQISQCKKVELGDHIP